LFFALETDQEGKEKHQDDLCAFLGDELDQIIAHSATAYAI
jgi:hypothetical protein